MKCPVCADTALQIAERKGIEIDYCPSCRGIWLDRGELDKIIERSLDDIQPEPPSQPDPRRADPRPVEAPRSTHRDDDYHYHERKRKKKDFFSDLFDF
ncbi:MAG TPA: zf-TFIIB domain-containing protein [Bacteroidota bacterium]|nr:zf-TFIIB domain-containing protein [Bacteroidota bacterium]